MTIRVTLYRVWTHLGFVLVCPVLQLPGLVEQVLPPLLPLLAHRAQPEEVLLRLQLLGCGERETGPRG